jgi:hypothetical protein
VLDSKQSQLRLANTQDELSLTQALVNASPDGRGRLAVTGGASNAVSAAKRVEQDLRAQIEKAQAVGGDAAEQEINALINKLNEAAASTSLAYAKGALALKEFDEQAAASAASERQSTLEKAMSEAMSQAKDAASGFKQAGASMAEAARSVVAAKEGAFKYLNRDEQLKLLDQARSDYSKVSIFKPLGRNVSDEEVLAAGSAARSVLNAQEQYSKVSQDLVSATNALVQKDWLVNVNVQGGDASAYGDVVNGALA